MTQYIKTNHSGLFRDFNTKAIINTNDSEYNKILEQRKINGQNQMVKDEIDNLRSEIKELKEMLKHVLNGKT